MKLLASAGLLLALQDRVCEHSTRGETRPLDLDAVARAYRDVARTVALRVDRMAAADPLAAPFESGLPACRARGRRTARIEAVPQEMVGRKLHFGPRAREGTVHVVTSAKALRDVVGAAMASPELAARFGVRCAGSTVRIASATEVEIDEGD